MIVAIFLIADALRLLTIVFALALFTAVILTLLLWYALKDRLKGFWWTALLFIVVLVFLLLLVFTQFL
ncbi:hypothetical protein AMR72_17695 [Flavobacterium psychrophilum]|nr:hypothetical protein AMR72_17695 [Flavobacterium psychrophilum]AOE54174.1 hypothetical protein ALW18_17680 [Flavobacterium psychrophilum]